MRKITSAVMCVLIWSSAAVARETLSGPEGWLGKALLIERISEGQSGRWEPYKAVDLKRAAESDSSASGPHIAVWSEGVARRVEITCEEQVFAWENLNPGASAQLEFRCKGVRYRAQVGSVVIEMPQAAPVAIPVEQDLSSTEGTLVQAVIDPNTAVKNSQAKPVLSGMALDAMPSHEVFESKVQTDSAATQGLAESVLTTDQ